MANPMFNTDGLERCPGCGNVIVRQGGKVIGRNFCWPWEVDTTQPGYRYAENIWGYCYTLHRHYNKDEFLERIQNDNDC